jgi:sialidase-1
MSLEMNRETPESGIAGDGTSSLISRQEGFVTLRTPQTSASVAAAPRCALTSEGELVCTFIVQSELGSNDFVPILTRSHDGGLTWTEQGPLWLHLQKTFSIFGSVSRDVQGNLFFYGTQTPIDVPGETFWCEATQGLKANELIWARSIDGGRSWSDPQPIPLPFPGSAEAPGAMCVARDGAWHACYSPYNTFDPEVVVPRNQVVLVSSRDQGRTWQHRSMLRFHDPLATAAEAWVIELSDGRLLGACWNLNQRDGSDYPNAFAISHDSGRTWSPTCATGIMGQSCALAAKPDGSVLFVYNQRKHGKIGVWLAVAQPTYDNFNALSNNIVWAAQSAPSQNEHSQWTQFTFGEPSVLLLEDGSILVIFWSMEQGVGAIRYVKLVASIDVPGRSPL